MLVVERRRRRHEAEGRVHGGRHDTVGDDLVNHCVNDILVQGAEPLFFLDYLATGRLVAGGRRSRSSTGMARACRENGCALLGGETAEMPGFYADGEYDVAGFIVGVVDRDAADQRHDDRAGDVLDRRSVVRPAHQRLLAGAAHRLRSSASSTSTATSPELGATVGEALLEPHRSYLPLVAAARRPDCIKGMAHITGGGITDNLPRVLPHGTAARRRRVVVAGAAAVHVAAAERRRADDDMMRTFNMGIGLIVVVRARTRRSR